MSDPFLGIVPVATGDTDGVNFNLQPTDPANLTDGDVGTYSAIAPGVISGTQHGYWTMDLTSPIAIPVASLVWVTAGPTNRLSLEYSTDNVAWSVAVSGAAFDAARVDAGATHTSTVTFGTITARYWRLVFTYSGGLSFLAYTHAFALTGDAVPPPVPLPGLTLT